MGGELDWGAVSKDHAGGADEGTLGSLLHQSTVAQDQSRRSIQQDGGKGSLELDLSAVSKDHAGRTNEGTLGTKLQVVAVLSDDAGGTNQHHVAGELVAELSITGGTHDAGGTHHVLLGSHVVRHRQRRCGGGSLEGSLTGCQLQVFAITCYDA